MVHFLIPFQSSSPTPNKWWCSVCLNWHIILLYKYNLLKVIAIAFRYSVLQTGRMQEFIFRFSHIWGGGRKKKKKVEPSGYIDVSYNLGIWDLYTKCALLHFLWLTVSPFFNDRHASNWNSTSCFLIKSKGWGQVKHYSEKTCHRKKKKK